MKRVAITGMGLVSCLGRGIQDHSKALLEAKNGFSPLQLFETAGIEMRPVGQVATEHLWNDPRASRSQRLAMTACADALPTQGLRGAGMMAVGTTTGGIDGTEQHYLKHRGKEGLEDRELLRQHPLGTVADRLARTFHLEGERHTFSTACSSSANAIGYAAMRVAAGMPWAIAGGVDALCRTTYCGFYSLKLLSEQACRPFDKNRSGLSLGEAAAFVLLESEESVQKNGRPVLGWMCGWGCAGDAYHMTAPHPEGVGAISAIDIALKDARVSAEQIDYVNAHGTATPANDKMEARALQAVFKGHMPWVSSTKGATGHTLGAAGALEAILSIITMRLNRVPKTVGLQEIDTDAEVRHADGREVAIQRVLSTSFGFGGNNTALVLERGAV